jgi:hypothetical protein
MQVRILFLPGGQYAELKSMGLGRIVQKFGRRWELFGGTGLRKIGACGRVDR